MSTKTQMKPLPKWFDGAVYPKGDTVKNILTGEQAELNANELSMYDFIIGCDMILELTNLASDYVKIVNEMRKGINWFRSANPSAYMTLLD